MSIMIQQSISNLHVSSAILDREASNYLELDNEMSYQLDQLSASLRAHANELSELMFFFGDV